MCLSPQLLGDEETAGPMPTNTDCNREHFQFNISPLGENCPSKVFTVYSLSPFALLQRQPARSVFQSAQFQMSGLVETSRRVSYSRPTERENASPPKPNYVNCCNVADVTAAMSLLLRRFEYCITSCFRELVGMKNADSETVTGTLLLSPVLR